MLEYNKKFFGLCDRKKDARIISIIESYIKFFGQNNLPQDKQYWTLCGQMSHGNELQKYCELNHMVSEKLITPNQFYGVELNKIIHNKNVEIVQTSTAYKKNNPNLIHGEISQVLNEHLGTNKLNPHIINLDTVSEPKNGVIILAKTMDILNYVDSPVMVIWNVLMYHSLYNRKHSWKDVADLLEENSLFRYSYQYGWSQFKKKVFSYKGTGKSASKMGIVVFVRKGKALTF